MCCYCGVRCITKWLHTRKHCPLCLQQVDNAHDVARHDHSSKPVEVDSAGAGAGGAVVAVPVVAIVSGSEDGVRMEVSAAPSSTVVDGGSSQRRSASGQEEGVAVAVPRTSDSRLEGEQKEQD